MEKQKRGDKSCRHKQKKYIRKKGREKK